MRWSWYAIDFEIQGFSTLFVFLQLGLFRPDRPDWPDRLLLQQSNFEKNIPLLCAGENQCLQPE
ncbi:MAG: hypothetical protein QM579_07950 [Desulfovibrio sp.]